MTTALIERPAEVARVVTTDELALIKTTVAVGATDAELKLFLFDCARQGVHPLDRLIHFTVRKDNHGNRKYTPITSIDFMRIRAADSGEMAGSDDPVFTLGDERIHAPHTATVTVYRMTQGQRFAYTATARWDEYKPEQNDFMWRKMPHTMLGKCAEALALRKGFPRQLAGLYAKEEMEQAESAPAPVVSVTTRERENPAAATGETRGTPRREVAQTVERCAEATEVAGSTPVLPAEIDGELPAGYHRIDDVRPDGNWCHVTWGRDAQGGSIVYKTKIPKIATAAQQAYTDRIPVKVVCKKFPYLDAVEPLDGWPTAEQIAATKWDPEAPPLTDDDIPFAWFLPFMLPAIGLIGAVLA